MSIPHASSGEIIDVRPLGSALRGATSRTLIRADHLEVFRMVLPTGKATPMHQASGIITIQCLEGEVELEAHDRQQMLRQGDLVYLADAQPHAVKAVSDASLLITVLLHRR